jgi:hypothetical protein
MREYRFAPYRRDATVEVDAFPDIALTIRSTCGTARFGFPRRSLPDAPLRERPHDLPQLNSMVCG